MQLKAPKTIIYYVPHQDDETLSMSVDILNNVEQGSNVILLLYTRGEGSRALKQLNGLSYSSYWKGFHNPQKEGYVPISQEKFVTARTQEFQGAARKLGVAANNVLVHPINGALTVDALQEAMLDMEAKYPGALHKTMSYYDTHSQHAIAGKALRGLLAKNKIKEGLFFVSIDDWMSSRGDALIFAKYEQRPKY